MQVDIHDSISEIDASDWNRISGKAYPFLRHEFLAAAESSGSVSPDTGWTPRHLSVRAPDGSLRALMPLYEKSHSWGEFVFDWSWAEAYQRAGIDYYPKLISAIPFTPAPSSRIMLADSEDREVAGELLAAAIQLADETDCSSFHVLFPDPEELPLLRESGLQVRKDCQFHWHNQGYRCFDDFLGKFSSTKRKKAKRERRRVAEDGITFRWLHGNDADAALWKDVYQLISVTFLRRGSIPYFDLGFFLDVSRHLPGSILLVLAERQGELIAAAVFYEGEKVLYGRYWGADSHYNSLHFETCYYQGIEFCIDRGLQSFEPGAQGEYKIARGFLPTRTTSLHWIEHPEFRAGIEKFLHAECRQIRDYAQELMCRSPFRHHT